MFRHEALLAAVLAESGAGAADVIGVVHDSGGSGPDGTIWGGEILIPGPGAGGGTVGLERAGLLFPVRMPGGEAATDEPWRMACAWLAAATGEDPPPVPPALAGTIEPERWEAVADMARTGLASPLTTSTGLLLDAVDSLSGLAGLEGRPAAAAAVEPALPMPLIEEGDAPLILDARETVREALEALASGERPATVRGRVIGALAEGTARAVTHVAARSGHGTAALAGDVFAERALLDRTAELLAAEGIRVLTPRRS